MAKKFAFHKVMWPRDAPSTWTGSEVDDYIRTMRREDLERIARSSLEYWHTQRDVDGHITGFLWDTGWSRAAVAAVVDAFGLHPTVRGISLKRNAYDHYTKRTKEEPNE